EKICPSCDGSGRGRQVVKHNNLILIGHRQPMFLFNLGAHKSYGAIETQSLYKVQVQNENRAVEAQSGLYNQVQVQSCTKVLGDHNKQFALASNESTHVHISTIF